MVAHRIHKIIVLKKIILIMKIISRIMKKTMTLTKTKMAKIITRLTCATNLSNIPMTWK